MKNLNLGRLMDSCCIEIDREYYEELFDYLIDTDVDLNTLNIDDLVVNGVRFLDSDDKYEAENNHYILSKTEDGYWVI